ncbi:MAG TPA: hypothetical protein VF444_18195 [Pseudonocardiaceae bacterium]
MTGILAALTGSEEQSTPIWLQIPDGYIPLPLTDIQEHMAEALAMVSEVAPEDTRPAVAPLVGDLTYLLGELAARHGLYCGIGHHVSPEDGSQITSSLVVALQTFPEKTNPRVLLKDLVLKKEEEGERGQVDLVDIQGRPILFFERNRRLPTPQIPGQPSVPEGATSEIYQLEALIPSDDGSKLASIEFSTPFVSHGPEFRAMVVIMAATVSFDPPAPSVASEPDDDTGTVGYRSIADVLNG